MSESEEAEDMNLCDECLGEVLFEEEPSAAAAEPPTKRFRSGTADGEETECVEWEHILVGKPPRKADAARDRKYGSLVKSASEKTRRRFSGVCMKQSKEKPAEFLQFALRKKWSMPIRDSMKRWLQVCMHVASVAALSSFLTSDIVC